MQSKTSFKPLYRVSNSFVPITGFCVKCGNETIKHDYNDHIINGTFEQYKVKIGPHIIECPSGHGGEDDFEEVWHTCLKCGENSLECDECHNYTRLVKFPCQYIKDDHRYKIIRKKNKEYIFQRAKFNRDENRYIDCDDNIQKIPSNMKIYSINFKEWYLTGMDGSRCSVFKCFLCDKVVEIYDD